MLCIIHAKHDSEDKQVGYWQFGCPSCMRNKIAALRAENERLRGKLDKKVLWGDGVRIILGEVSMQLHYKLNHTDKDDGCVEWPCQEVGYYLSRDEERCLKRRAAAALKGDAE